MVIYPFKKPDAQNIVPNKNEKIMKKNKNFFLISVLEIAIFVEFDEKSNSAGINSKSSGSIAIIAKTPFIPNTLKNDDRVKPNTKPLFAKTAILKTTPALKNADISKTKNITENSFIAPIAVLYLLTDDELFKKETKYSSISILFSPLIIPQ